jgi:Galactose oxidase, central domain
MKTKQNSFVRASAVQITFMSLLAVSLTLGAAPQLQQKPSGASIALETAKSLTPPTGLKPVEQEAWLAIARRRQDASAGVGSPRWVTTGSMGTARAFHTATLLESGEVLVAGGYLNGALSSAELYDPSSGTWTPTGSMRTARDSHTATLLPSG